MLIHFHDRIYDVYLVFGDSEDRSIEITNDRHETRTVPIPDCLILKPTAMPEALIEAAEVILEKQNPFMEA